MLMTFIAAAALQGASPRLSQHSIDKAVAKAGAVASCSVGPDCDRKWQRARTWVLENSRFALAVDTDSILLTYPAIYANTDPSFAIALDPPREGHRTIRFRAWCGNWISCAPSPKSLRALFVQAMADADREPATPR